MGFIKKTTIAILLMVSIVFSQGELFKTELVGYSANELSKYSGLKDISGYNKDFTVVVLDTGVTDHRDLSDSITIFKDFVNDLDEKYDDYGHGTEVSGIIAGNGYKSNGNYLGVNPSTQICMLKVFNHYGELDLVALTKAVNWIVENKEKYQIRVVNMSFGFEDYSFHNFVLEELINRLFLEEIILVGSAGNRGETDSEITIPGRYDEVLTAGSLNYTPNRLYGITESNISLFSSTKINGIESRKPDFYVPGERVITTSSKSDDDYVVVSGTSFAAAILTGQITLLIEKYPELDNKEIVELVFGSTKASGRKVFVSRD
ncbi:S8 family serine peptidase [Paenibacillus sp. RRE4]|uniref:S8 family serine peptidase n=1 Tax=Paenibacillus sp. RRE4 TaxID=2962587 RepID=UPI0028817390|nr:S8 family serine peptidase [Paenibacillus sp. RRE4]MDT0124616.1 S8 family serine peptidase [Paenibacillus sp. RRE4]